MREMRERKAKWIKKLRASQIESTKHLPKDMEGPSVKAKATDTGKK
jgi:hypothetical protein